MRAPLIWFDMRLKDRLSVSSSEKRSFKFMSKRGRGRRLLLLLPWPLPPCCEYPVARYPAPMPLISVVSARASASDVEVYAVPGEVDDCAASCICALARSA